MMACTVTIFDRPLRDLPPNDATAVRRHLDDDQLDDCPDCATIAEHRRFIRANVKRGL